MQDYYAGRCTGVQYSIRSNRKVHVARTCVAKSQLTGEKEKV